MQAERDDLRSELEGARTRAATACVDMERLGTAAAELKTEKLASEDVVTQLKDELHRCAVTILKTCRTLLHLEGSSASARQVCWLSSDVRRPRSPRVVQSSRRQNGCDEIRSTNERDVSCTKLFYSVKELAVDFLIARNATLVGKDTLG